MKIHKYYRDIKHSSQFRLCDDKKCDFAENVVYQWRKVTCKTCLAKRKVR